MNALPSDAQRGTTHFRERTLVNIARTSELESLERADQFKHFLWRRHLEVGPAQQALPEVIATDGRIVRRMIAKGAQITFQEFEDVVTSSALIDRIESSASPGVALVGYSMLKRNDALAVLHTGRDLEPGWLAFPDRRTGSSAALPTLPSQLAEYPRLRLIAGVNVAQEQRRLTLRAALEQRGSSFLSSPRAFAILDHLSGWRIRAVSGSGETAKPLEIAPDSEPLFGFQRTSALRSEACFELDAAIYHQRAKLGVHVWFELEFDRALFCLPSRWLRFPLYVQGLA